MLLFSTQSFFGVFNRPWCFAEFLQIPAQLKFSRFFLRFSISRAHIWWQPDAPSKHLLRNPETSKLFNLIWVALAENNSNASFKRMCYPLLPFKVTFHVKAISFMRSCRNVNENIFMNEKYFLSHFNSCLNFSIRIVRVAKSSASVVLEHFSAQNWTLQVIEILTMNLVRDLALEFKKHSTPFERISAAFCANEAEFEFLRHLTR